MSAPRHRRGEPNAGHVAAIAAALLSGAGLIALGITGAVSNRLTPREVVAGCIAIAVGAVAAFLLRRDRLGRRS